MTRSNTLQEVNVAVDFVNRILKCEYGYNWDIDNWVLYGRMSDAAHYRTVVKNGDGYLQLYKSMQDKIKPGDNILSCRNECPPYDIDISFHTWMQLRNNR